MTAADTLAALARCWLETGEGGPALHDLLEESGLPAPWEGRWEMDTFGGRILPGCGHFGGCACRWAEGGQRPLATVAGDYAEARWPLPSDRWRWFLSLPGCQEYGPKGTAGTRDAACAAAEAALRRELKGVG